MYASGTSRITASALLPDYPEIVPTWTSRTAGGFEWSWRLHRKRPRKSGSQGLFSNALAPFEQMPMQLIQGATSDRRNVEAEECEGWMDVNFSCVRGHATNETKISHRWRGRAWRREERLESRKACSYAGQRSAASFG